MYWLARIGKTKVLVVTYQYQGEVIMKQWLSLGCIFTFIACATAETADLRDFSIDTFWPSPNEIRLAEKHCQNYWTKHRAQYSANTRYLAVEAAAVFPAEVVNNLWLKLINSETANDFFAHGDRFSYSNLDLKGILIYDTLNIRFVSTWGYISVDLPRRNQLARWDRYVARFIGTGRWY
jgi:hypothetical protein